MPRWLIHLGYPKAGSTFLQSCLFSGDHPSCYPFGFDTESERRKTKPGQYLFFNRLHGERGYLPFEFDPTVKRQELRDGSTQSTDQITVLSTEELVGHPYSGGIWAEGIAARIHATVPEARFLIKVREQRKMLLSAYSDFLERKGGMASLEHFLRPRGIDQVPAHIPQFYAFARLISHYSNLFGRANLLVLTLEGLAKDPDRTVRRISDFCDVPYSDAWKAIEPSQNARDYRSYAVLRNLRGMNRWWSPRAANGHSGRNVPGLRDAVKKTGRLFVSESSARRIMDRDLNEIETALAPFIPEDNARLQDFVKDDLRALGYMMP